jgi:uncharacterized membrane protein YjjP (DUF1212 family)
MRIDRTHSRDIDQQPDRRTNWVALLSTLGGIMGGLVGLLVGAWSASAVAAFAGSDVPVMRRQAQAFAYLGIIVGAALGALVGVMIQGNEAPPQAKRRAQASACLRVQPRSRRRRRTRR